MVDPVPFQGQLDTRAIEVALAIKEQAAETRKLAEKVEQRIADHERDCHIERRRADEQRAELRQEVANGFEKVRETIDLKMSLMHGKVNRLVIGIGAAVISLLVGISGFLLKLVMHW